MMLIPEDVLLVSATTLRTGAVISPCRKYRYALWRMWGDVVRSGYVMFVGLNPSTADETVDDPTIRRCVGFAKSWGYAGLVMTNLFAFRTTDPALMKRVGDPIGPENDRYLQAQDGYRALVVAAWGTYGAHRNRDLEVANMLHPMFCLAVTKDGHPAHPLYLAKHLRPAPFSPKPRASC